MIGADVDEERITCRNGCSSEGVSKVRMSLQPTKSALKRANADMSGLSCMLFPFLPLSPHLLARLWSPSPVPASDLTELCLAGLIFVAGPFLGLGGLDVSCSYTLVAPPPPKIAETDDWDHRECFLIAEVTVMHSVVMRATGSTAIEMAGRGSRVPKSGSMTWEW